MNICHKAVEAWDRLRHRIVAALLAAAMTLSLLPATSWATSPITPPTQITETTKSEFPKIEFQTNFVRTEYGTLTGLMELAIRVGPSATAIVDGKEVAVPVSFQSVAATLQYNTTLFQPISWQWAFGEMGEATPVDIDLKNNVTSYYNVQLPAKKDDTLPGTGAIAQCGIVDPAPTGMSTNVTNGEQALLFFKAEAYGPAITIAEMTTLAVVRFYVDPALMEHISILRDKITGDYSVLFDGKKTEADWITDRDKLDAAIMGTKGQLKDDPSDDKELDPDLTKLLPPTEFTSVGFAIDGDMARSQSPADMSLHYSTGGNEFYYVPGYDPDTSVPETVDIEIGPNNGKVPVSLSAPATEGERILAVAKDAPTDSTDPDDYSYFSNLIPTENISFPVVSQMSFADNGDGRENMATVLFYDWDDTLIGVLVVPRNDDARALVNEYVRDNMIHPDLRFAAGSATQTTDITSLARKDTYRGKYPYSAPMADGAGQSEVETEVDEDGNIIIVGEKYPLTNKLDYVFLKRPMTQTAKGETATGEPTSTWTQPGTTGDVVWDDEYPYIHGWALIPDKDLTDIQYTHPENVWTTIGMGELSDYNGALSGGYQSMNEAPGELTASGQEFTIANFDFHENPQKKGTVYAVKAIYEPGESLLSQAYNYRMSSEPYYNKLNYYTADGGGAYEVAITYERSSFQVENVLRGVARIREPAVRQNTTTDLRWENVEGLGNPTISDAYSTRAKTTFTKIEVENLDEISFSMALSARHNRIDYFLSETYGGFNFVSGNARMNSNNMVRGTSSFVIDNYNYDTGDDDTDRKDIYYDATYEDRDGSYGFVLYGTLNNIMEQATISVVSGTGNFTSHASNGNLADANIHHANGTIPTSAIQGSQVRNLILEAARAAFTHKGQKDEADYWDSVHNCAQLTYHQLQLYILEQKLYSRSDADAIPIKWCHLHETCAALAAGKPTSFEAMVKLAVDGDPEGKITLLDLSTAQRYADLRSNKNGTAYTSIEIYAADFIDAVQGLYAIDSGFISGIDYNDEADVTKLWDAIQGWIISDNTPGSVDAAIQVCHDTAWWYAGNTYPSRNLAGVVDAAQKANTLGRDAWLNYLESAFDDMKANGVTPSCQWTQYTENLTKKDDNGEGGEAFDTFDDFKTEIKKTVAVTGLDLTAWGDIQYAILHNYTVPVHSGEGQPTTSDEDEIAKYWWRYGRSRITGLISLFAAAQDAISGDSTVLDMLTAEELYKFSELRFRSGFNGVKNIYVDDTDSSGNPTVLEDGQAYLSDFKEAVMNFVRANRAVSGAIASNASQVETSWMYLQYWLIHPGVDFTNSTVRKAWQIEAGTGVGSSKTQGYYWWHVSESGEDYAISAGTGTSNINSLMEAVYRASENGNPKALTGLTAATAEQFKLSSDTGYGSKATWADLEKYESDAQITVLKGKLQALMQSAVQKGDDRTAITWRQIQHYLLTDSYVDNAALAADDTLIPPEDENGYWWRTNDTKPGGAGEPTKYDIDRFLDILDQYIASGSSMTEDDLLAQVETYYNSERLNIHTGSTTRNYLYEDAATTAKKRAQTNTKKYLVALANRLKSDGVATVVGVVDWYVLQYYSFNSVPAATPLQTPAGAKIALGTKVTWAPADGHTSYGDGDSSRMATYAMDFPQTMVETDPDTRIMTTTTPDTITELPGGLVQLQRTVTVLSPAGEILEITTLIEIYDADYNLISSQTVTMPTPETEELICTCGSEDGTHAEDCPLYVTSEEPACTCGSEDDTHAEDCPLYVAPEEPICICGSEDGVHAEDCPLYVAPEAPVESPEVTEPPEPSESAEPTPPPQPEETEPPQEELPQPSVPGSEEPEVTPAPGPTPTLEPTPTPEPTESRELEYTIETMPEVVDPVTEDIFEDEPTEEADTETDTSDDPPETEVTVVETLPPLGIPRMIQTRSATMDYRKLTTKIVKTKSLTSAGGMKMKQLKLKRIISPPGQMGIPLLLRAETMERRFAV